MIKIRDEMNVIEEYQGKKKRFVPKNKFK